MKRIKTIILIISCLAISMGVFGCGADGYGGFGGGYGYKTHDAAIADGGHGSETGEAPDSGESTGQEQYQRPAGLITAAAWNDNRYYEYFKSLFDEPESANSSQDTGLESEQVVSATDGGEETGLTATEAGKFYNYYSSDRWGFNALNRVTVNVTVNDHAQRGAVITYYAADQSERYAVTDANGVAYIFPDDNEGEFTVACGEYSKKCAYNTENDVVDVAMEHGMSEAPLIKLMFVVDVTGSMGDEISYLTNELYDVINRVARSYNNVKIDLAFLFYRDDGDQEKFAYFDFTTVADRTLSDDANLKAQLKNLGTQHAQGGGDYPEASDEALNMAVSKNWGTENSTKIIFHVYDAPPHEKQINKTTYESAVRTAAQKGIRINPILCSGADMLCEYLARQTAIHTAGHFIFVTDDSGIGNPHYDPGIPNAVVERLNDLMVRLIDGYYTGTFAEPVYWKQAYKESMGKVYYTSKHFSASVGGYNKAVVIDSVEKASESEQDLLSYYSLQSGEQYFCTQVRGKLLSYDEEFFASRKVVYVAITISYMDSRTINDVYLDGDKIVVEILAPVHSDDVGFSGAIETHFFFIEIDKTVGGDTVEVKIV